MKCPYCLSQIEDGVHVCKFCTRDLYLFEPMLKKIADLEKKLADVPNRQALEMKISELEEYIEENQRIADEKTEGWFAGVLQIIQYLLLPLAILLIAHGLITVIYDLNLVFLRVVSMIVPLPFAFILFSKCKRSVLPWFGGAVLLATLSVVGMSAITTLVDNTPIMPQTPIEWKEFIEYSASVSFSFLTGMLLGGMSYVRRNRIKTSKVNPWVAAVIAGLGDGKLSPDTLQRLMHKVNDFGGTAVALGTTLISIYTGLKGVIG